MTEKKHEKRNASPQPLREVIPGAALALAGERGWENITLRDIAARAGVGLAEIYDLYCDKTDILAGYGRMVDRATLERAGMGENSAGDDSAENRRDRLFDLVMERFEILNDHRAGVLSVLRGLWRDPKQAVIGAPHLARSMAWMLAAAGINTEGLRGAARLPDLLRYPAEQRRRFRFEKDVHPTPEGHEALAASLAPALARVLPPPG